jgi:hypothetical protein
LLSAEDEMQPKFTKDISSAAVSSIAHSDIQSSDYDIPCGQHTRGNNLT